MMSDIKSPLGSPTMTYRSDGEASPFDKIAKSNAKGLHFTGAVELLSAKRGAERK